MVEVEGGGDEANEAVLKVLAEDEEVIMVMSVGEMKGLIESETEFSKGMDESTSGRVMDGVEGEAIGFWENLKKNGDTGVGEDVVGKGVEGAEEVGSSRISSS